MVRFLIFTIISVVFLIPSPSSGKEQRDFVFNDGLTLSFELPGERWRVSRQAPEYLVKETVDHVRLHLDEDGRALPENLEEVISGRLAQNELYIYNPESRAHFDLDLSPLESGQNAPSEKAVAESVEYAKAELSQEKDITDVIVTSRAAELTGARSVFRIDASFNRDGDPRIFVGLIGYVEGYWFFFYYTDKNQDKHDLIEFESLLDSFSFRNTGS